MRSKEAMAKSYDESRLPWPIKPLMTLDYCWRLNYTMWRHSFILGFPITTIYFIYTRMPGCWSLTRRTFPYRGFLYNYICAVLVINTVNTGSSLLVDGYCDRHSDIYNPKLRNTRALKQLIKETNDAHRNTVEAQINKPLTADEVLG